MSLAGIAIAIGTMVDMGIIVSENIYQHLADWEKEGSPGGRRAPQHDHFRSGDRSRSGGGDGRHDDDRQLPAGVLPHRPRLQAVQPAGLDKDICHRLGIVGGDYARARPLPVDASQCALARKAERVSRPWSGP